VTRFIRVKQLFLSATVLLATSVTLKAQSAISGMVLGTDNRPVEAVTVIASRADRTVTREAITDAQGRFRLGPLTAGSYTVTARKLGYQSAELVAVRVPENQTVSVNVTLTQAPRQLSTIEVVTSPTSVNASTPELTIRLDRRYTELVPSARTATSLIALVPGARKDQLWGGAPGVTNNYQLDGVSVNHPGVGGDFLALSVDWIETLDVRGLGAGAEHGNFQGGIINAITKTGSNERRYTFRSNYESPELTSSNFNLGEQGVEQAGRREIGGELLGPIARDRLFYFVAGQYVGRDLRSPDLATTAARDFQTARERQQDARALAKLTWLPALGHRVDLLGGYSDFEVDHAGINGVDDPTGLQRVSQPTSYYSLSWKNEARPRDHFEVRLAGFTASESRTGYLGTSVPGLHVLQPARQPRFQNAEFTEVREPRSASGTVEWRSTRQLGTTHRLVVGAEGTRGWWRDQRTRNGGLTWRPYPADTGEFDALDPETWFNAASIWGGEIRLKSDVASEAVYVQDHIDLGPRLTLAPGLRYGHWAGYIQPNCEPPLGRAGCHRFEAVRAEGLDPRIGVSWDVTGRNTFAIKAHWGRYHQGMHALFFDRAAGSNVYSNEIFNPVGPRLADPTQTFTPEQRDTPGSGFSLFPSVKNRDVTGRVEGYRQPYVDQTVVAIEKSFGSSWKAELTYTHRKNRDIVGLVDRNAFTNYTLLADVHVENLYVRGGVLGTDGQRLVLPFVYIANIDFKNYLADLNSRREFPDTLFGYPTEYIRALAWNPDVVLTTVPDAKRWYDQFTAMVRTVQPQWRVDGSLTVARLKGNVAGVTGYGTTATRFTAGQFVNPNEGLNSYGYLPDALQMEGKVWATARLPYSLQGGLLYTHTLGERFTPTFELEGRYVYRDGLFGDAIVGRTTNVIMNQVLGQQLLLEPRGDRHYASRAVVDAHLEWRSPRRAVLTLDVFNVLGENELVAIKTEVQDQFKSDPTTLFGAPRLRAAPRTLRLGLRVE
jgi:hypothetical protein